MKPEKNIISQLFSFVWVSRIYGCLPFSLKEYREESTRVLIFPLGILYGSVLVTGPALYRIIINLFFKEGYSENAVFKSSAILSCVTSLISFFSYTRNIKTVQSVYEKNLEYSKEIKREDFFKKAFWVTNGEIFLSEFLCIGYYLSYFLSYPDFFFVAEMVMEHILRYVITLFRFQFANSLFLLHAIFNLANEELHEVFKSKRMLVESNLKKSDGKILHVSKTISLYTKASDSCVVLNSCFGPTLASASIVMMLQIVLCCYTLVTKNITISMFLFWFGSFVIEEWFVLFSCEKVIREVRHQHRTSTNSSNSRRIDFYALHFFLYFRPNEPGSWFII